MEKNIIMEDFICFRFEDVIGSIPIISICKNPSDFPGRYTARLFDCNSPTPYVVVKDSLDEIRRAIPKDRFLPIPRKAIDDPVIIEVWI